jgi:hypothetical protein
MESLGFKTLSETEKCHHLFENHQRVVSRSSHRMSHYRSERAPASRSTRTDSNIQEKPIEPPEFVSADHTIASKSTQIRQLVIDENENEDAIAIIDLYSRDGGTIAAGLNSRCQQMTLSSHHDIKLKRSFRRSFALRPLPLSPPTLSSP